MSNNGGSCPRCGGWVNGRFCGNCGASVTPEAPAPGPPPPNSGGHTPTWGASLGMMWPGVEDDHIMGGKTMSASDILTYYRGLQDRFPGKTYLVKANQVGKQNSNHAAHPDAWQLLVPLNADDGKDADKWCRENMNGDATYTCARQKINDPH